MVDTELEELRREFLVEANEKVHEMELSAVRLSPESLERLTHLAHQLKGSGGSYGFQVISEEAAEVETAIEDGGSAETIAQHVSKLRAEIDRLTNASSLSGSGA
jgi:HPt (histidine-containing phosphotransfer) domain-containing protein